MDSKKIYALLAAIDCGSLTATAEKLGYTQSGLTHMMNSLENELGLNLLVRSKSGVHLSPAGRSCAAMRAFSEAADGLEQAADKLRQHSFTTLRLGAYTSVTRQWLPAILAAYRDICPDTEVSISMGDSVGTYEAVRNDELDCAVVSYQPHLCQGLSWTHLRDDELVAILPPTAAGTTAATGSRTSPASTSSCQAPASTLTSCPRSASTAGRQRPSSATRIWTTPRSSRW